MIIKYFSDIALKIVKKRPELASDGNVLRILAKKPDAFVEKSSNILWKTVNWGKHFYSLIFNIDHTCQITFHD